ncbi:M48 family peptidase [bacterium]|nr:M48 family peptidase [bacterium]
MNIIVEGLSVTVTKKNIKNLHLYVMPPDGKIKVTAPQSLSYENIEIFLRTKIKWIIKQQQKFTNQERQIERLYTSGESFYVWGKQYFLQVEYSYRANSLVLSGNNAVLTVRKESTKTQRSNYVNEWYRDILVKEIIKRLPYWEKQVELNCRGWRTKYMTTRWGSCNTATKRILFNLQLAKKPYECLDYVIVHELGHLNNRRHDDKFFAFMDTHLPQWKEIRDVLNSRVLDCPE